MINLSSQEQQFVRAALVQLRSPKTSYAICLAIASPSWITTALASKYAIRNANNPEFQRRIKKGLEYAFADPIVQDSLTTIVARPGKDWFIKQAGLAKNLQFDTFDVVAEATLNVMKDLNTFQQHRYQSTLYLVKDVCAAVIDTLGKRFGVPPSEVLEFGAAFSTSFLYGYFIGYYDPI
jgi:hypothetical protein